MARTHGRTLGLGDRFTEQHPACNRCKGRGRIPRASTTSVRGRMIDFVPGQGDRPAMPVYEYVQQLIPGVRGTFECPDCKGTGYAGGRVPVTRPPASAEERLRQRRLTRVTCSLMAPWILVVICLVYGLRVPLPGSSFQSSGYNSPQAYRRVQAQSAAFAVAARLAAVVSFGLILGLFLARPLAERVAHRLGYGDPASPPGPWRDDAVATFVGGPAAALCGYCVLLVGALLFVMIMPTALLELIGGSGADAATPEPAASAPALSRKIAVTMLPTGADPTQRRGRRESRYTHAIRMDEPAETQRRLRSRLRWRACEQHKDSRKRLQGSSLCHIPTTPTCSARSGSAASRWPTASATCPPTSARPTPTARSTSG